MRRFTLSIVALGMLFGSCARASNMPEMVSYECLLDSDKKQGYQPLRFTFSLKTGKAYTFDDFSEELVVQDGFVGSGFGPEDVRIRNHVRSALVGDTWKWRHELGMDVIVERHINLKTLNYAQYTVGKYSSAESKGKCRKVAPPKYPVRQAG